MGLLEGVVWGAVVVAVPVGVGVGVVEVDVGVVDVVLHDSVTPVTGTLTGNGIEETGVPGGTFTVKLSVWPVEVVTVTTQLSARAEESGIAESPRIAAAVAATLIQSFRLLVTRVLLPLSHLPTRGLTSRGRY